MVDNYIFIIIVIIRIVLVNLDVVIVVVVVVILRQHSRVVTCRAASNERSQRVADLAADVRVRQVQTDVHQCT